MQYPILTNNAFQNLGTAPLTRANMVGNLSVQNPTVEQMNEAITMVPEWSPPVTPEEPAFGVHAREAVDVVRRILR
jgi:hypothetical protein